MLFQMACSVTLKGDFQLICVIALPATMPGLQGEFLTLKIRLGVPALTANFIPPSIPREEFLGENGDGKGCFSTEPGAEQNGDETRGQEACGHT